MKYAFVIVLAALLVTSCTTTPQKQQPSVPVAPGYTVGTLQLAVTQCAGTYLMVKNAGTGTILLNTTSTVISARGGGSTYGNLAASVVIQPGETKRVDLTYDLTKADTKQFNIVVQSGSSKFIQPFDCGTY